MNPIDSFVSSYNYLDEYYLISKHYTDANIYAFLSLNYIQPPVPRTMVNDFRSVLKSTCLNFHLNQRTSLKTLQTKTIYPFWNYPMGYKGK